MEQKHLILKNVISHVMKSLNFATVRDNEVIYIVTIFISNKCCSFEVYIYQ